MEEGQLLQDAVAPGKAQIFAAPFRSRGQVRRGDAPERERLLAAGSREELGSASGAPKPQQCLDGVGEQVQPMEGSPEAVGKRVDDSEEDRLQKDAREKKRGDLEHESVRFAQAGHGGDVSTAGGKGNGTLELWAERLGARARLTLCRAWREIRGWRASLRSRGQVVGFRSGGKWEREAGWVGATRLRGSLPRGFAFRRGRRSSRRGRAGRRGCRVRRCGRR